MQIVKINSIKTAEQGVRKIYKNTNLKKAKAETLTEDLKEVKTEVQ